MDRAARLLRGTLRVRFAGKTWWRLTDAVSLLATVGAAEKSIVPRLRELDGLRRLTVQPDSHPDRTALTLVFAAGDSEPERRLFALLSRLGVPLLHLSRQSGDLEQVFLQAIADE